VTPVTCPTVSPAPYRQFSKIVSYGPCGVACEAVVLLAEVFAVEVGVRVILRRSQVRIIRARTAPPKDCGGPGC
jgi:hypothetical protein